MSAYTRQYAQLSYETAGNLALKPHAATRFALVEGGDRRSRDAARAEIRTETTEAAVVSITNIRSYLVVLCALAFTSVLFAGLVLLSDAQVARRQAHACASVVPVAIVVQPGDSLWGIAEEHGVRGMATSEVVSWIEAENALEGGLILAGETLLVPGA